MNPVLSEECSPKSTGGKYPLMPGQSGCSGWGRLCQAATWRTSALGTEGMATGDAQVPGCPGLGFLSTVCYFMVAPGSDRGPMPLWCPAVKHPTCPALRSVGRVTCLHGCASVACHKGEVVLEGFLPRDGTLVH